jgi:hypothetical protein
MRSHRAPKPHQRQHRQSNKTTTRTIHTMTVSPRWTKRSPSSSLTRVSCLCHPQPVSQVAHTARDLAALARTHWLCPLQRCMSFHQSLQLPLSQCMTRPTYLAITRSLSCLTRARDSGHMPVLCRSMDIEIASLSFLFILLFFPILHFYLLDELSMEFVSVGIRIRFLFAIIFFFFGIGSWL